MLLRILRDARHVRPEQVLFAFVFPCALLTAASFSVAFPSPQNEPFNGARFLNDIGIRPYADLREVEVAARPEGWDGTDVSPVRRVNLRGRNLAFADLTRAFLANADLRGANLTRALLDRAELQGADFYDENQHRPARLQGAVLNEAQLQGADLRFARLQDAILWGAQLQGADLSLADLQGAILRGAQLQGADLSLAKLQGAGLRDAQLQGADLGAARLQGADLRHAQLQGADLRHAQLQGADVRAAALWRAMVDFVSTSWDRADVRGAHVTTMENAEIDGLIAEATASIPYEESRKRVAEGLTAALTAEDRPERPDFPGIWASYPNVMFEHGDPEPEPLEWGRSRWESPEEYDRDLADLLGELACGPDVPKAQILGLWDRVEPDRLWPRLFADRVLGPNCPAADGLPEDLRRDLERLAAELKEEPVADAVPEAAPRAPAE